MTDARSLAAKLRGSLERLKASRPRRGSDPTAKILLQCSELDALLEALEKAEAVIGELSGDLGSALDAHYANTLDYPSQRARYERDMAPVRAAADWLRQYGKE